MTKVVKYGLMFLKNANYVAIFHYSLSCWKMTKISLHIHHTVDRVITWVAEPWGLTLKTQCEAVIVCGNPA